MGSITLQVVAAQESQFTTLQDAYRTHLRESLVPGVLKKLGGKK